ncbi:GH1 family beta-glucosidase [Nonomuraea sp. bgisy101]|uniref:GH1 family beta-glucosidase n=1 Tax=Nonomuraea sp. bgisy101 TaxID=3413784 RepID=UPI003D707B2E
MTQERRFPDGFRWGAATAAYQIEGAATEDGRGPSIWDVFARTPGRVHLGHTGDVACDHYHRYREDVALMSELGLPTYRFSISWPRIKPDGGGPVNPRGLDFYDRLVDELLAAGVEPMVTLYHWDLPQTLEDLGGWTLRDTAFHFADLASAVHARLGDRARTWTTLNEPWCSAFLGYASGAHAPGRTEPGAAFVAAHHLLLAHGLAVQALREAGARELSITLNLSPVVGDGEAARRIDGLHNRLFLDPILRGSYPEDLLPVIDRFAGLDHVRQGDPAVIAAPIDLLGVNYYRPTWVSTTIGRPPNAAFPGSEGVDFTEPDLPRTAMDWAIAPHGLTDLLVRLHRDYPGTPLMITENGAAFEDDADRLIFLRDHLAAAHAAIAQGAPLTGYLVWSFLDNFEWAWGYEPRFGIVHVDYATQRRTPKESALWLRDVIRKNALT